MIIGVAYPQNELGGDPEALRRFGTAVDALGYDHLLMFDHVLGAAHEGRDPPLDGLYSEKDSFHDPFVAFAYLAGITRALRFMTGVLVLPQRQTALVARQSADLSLLSGGRLALGVGIGWNPVEYGGMGQDFHTRGKRLEEQVGLLRRLWTEEAVDFEGRFDRIDRAGTLPRPTSPIPIYLGGFADVALRRAARIGDGFLFAFGMDTETEELWRQLQAILRENGRNVDTFHAQFLLNRASHAPTPKEIADGVQRLRDAGAAAGTVVSMGRGFDAVEQHIDFVAAVWNALDGKL
jgi:probable F420-dependent oxidoreductase